MIEPSQLTSSIIRAPSPSARCTCEHWVHCACACHGRHCDPSENTCDVAFMPDEGGLTRWGCPGCTPGEGAPHYLGCELIGWNVPMRAATLTPGGDDPGGLTAPSQARDPARR